LDFHAVFSPDGKRLITAADREVRVWEMPKGVCQQILPEQGFPTIPCPDGRMLAVVPHNERRAVRLVDLETGKKRTLVPDAAASAIGFMVFSANGETLATFAEGLARFWDVQSLRPRGRPLAAGDVHVLALSADGGTLAAVTRNEPKVVRFWDVADGQCRQVIAFDEAVEALTYSPQGDLLAVKRKDGFFGVLHNVGGRLVELRHLRPNGTGVAAFSWDGHRLAVAVHEQVWLWDLHDSTLRARLRWQATGIKALAFSPDGRVLAAGTDDGLLHRVGLDGPPPLDTLRPDLLAVDGLAVSPDGKTLALSKDDGTVRLVDAGSGELRRELPGHGGRLADCAFSPDGGLLATAGVYDPEVRLWDTATGKKTLTLRAGLWGVRCLAFSPQNGLLAAGDCRDSVWVWDLATKKRRGQLAGHNSYIHDLTFSSDGRVLAVCDGSTKLHLWNIPAQDTLPAALREKVEIPPEVLAAAFHPGERKLAVSSGYQVHLYEVPEAGPARKIGSPHSTDDHSRITHLAFAPKGEALLVGYRRWPDSGQLQVREVPTWNLIASLRCSLSADLHRAAWLPDGRLLVQTPNGIAQIRDPRTWSVRVLPGQTPWPVASLAFSPDGQSLYLGTTNWLDEVRSRLRVPAVPFVSGERWVPMDLTCPADVADAVRVWDVSSLRPKPRLEGEKSMALPDRIALSADGDLLAAGAADGRIWLWNLRQPRLLSQRLFISDRARRYAPIAELYALTGGKPQYPENAEGVRSLAFSPDGSWLAAAGEHGTVTVWDTKSWHKHHLFAGVLTAAAWVGFSPDSTLAVACKGQIRLCDPCTGAARGNPLGAEDDPPILAGAFSPDGCLLATGTAGQTVRVWVLATGTEKQVLRSHTNQVAAVAFSPDGKTLASGDLSGGVKLWSVATLEDVASLEGQWGNIHCLAFAPDGQTLAAGAALGPGEGRVFLWRAPGLAGARHRGGR
jgi:WD40 repeat protein